MKKLKYVGAGICVLALPLLLMGETGFAVIALLASVGISGYLAVKKNQTVSQWIQDLIGNRKIDLAIMVAVFVAIFYFAGVVAGLWATVGGLNVHFNGERW